MFFTCLFVKCFVYRTIMTATKTATISSVIGIANQIDSAGAMAGNNMIRIPLITAPLATETMKDVVGLINAWK